MSYIHIHTSRWAWPVGEVEEVHERLDVTPHQNLLADPPTINALEVLLHRRTGRRPARKALACRREAVSQPRFALGRACPSRYGGNSHRLHLVDSLVHALMCMMDIVRVYIVLVFVLALAGGTTTVQYKMIFALAMVEAWFFSTDSSTPC